MGVKNRVSLNSERLIQLTHGKGSVQFNFLKSIVILIPALCIALTAYVAKRHFVDQFSLGQLWPYLGLIALLAFASMTACAHLFNRLFHEDLSLSDSILCSMTPHVLPMANKNPQGSSTFDEHMNLFRKRFFTIMRSSPPPREFKSTIREFLEVPSRSRGRTITVAMRRPSDSNEGIFTAPLVLYIHGGGWVGETPKECDFIGARLAHRLSSEVASVFYRLAPEYKFPLPLEDCFDVLQYFIKINPNRKIILLGDSAGGNMCAALALMCRDQDIKNVALHVLINPCLIAGSILYSNIEFARSGVLLTSTDMQWVWNMYLKSWRDGESWMASPLRAPHFEGVCPAIIFASQNDVLRDEAAEYSKRLRRDGCDVYYKNVIGALHATFGTGPMGKGNDVFDESCRMIQTYIKKIIAKQNAQPEHALTTHGSSQEQQTLPRDFK